MESAFVSFFISLILGFIVALGIAIVQSNEIELLNNNIVKYCKSTYTQLNDYEECINTLTKKKGE